MCSNFIIPLSLSRTLCLLFIHLTNLWRVALINHMLKTLYSLALSFSAPVWIYVVCLLYEKNSNKKIILHYWLFIHSGLISLYFRTQFVRVCVCASKMMCLYSLPLHDIVYNTTKEASIYVVFLPHPSHYSGSVTNRFTINHSRVETLLYYLLCLLW